MHHINKTPEKCMDEIIHQFEIYTSQVFRLHVLYEDEVDGKLFHSLVWKILCDLRISIYTQIARSKNDSIVK